MADGSVGFQSVDGRPSSSHFIFDQETDDPYSYLLFEFTIAGTWEKAPAVIDAHPEITSHQTDVPIRIPASVYRWPGAREGHQTFAFLNRF